MPVTGSGCSTFTRRDDYRGYLWVLRAVDRLRALHVAQAHTDDVAQPAGTGDVLMAGPAGDAADDDDDETDEDDQ